MLACDTPEPEVLAPDSGHKRTTNTWVLGRLLRDLEYAVDREMAHETEHAPPAASRDGDTRPAKTVDGQVTEHPTWTDAPIESGSITNPTARAKTWETLRVDVYEVENPDGRSQGVPSSGFVAIAVQLIISIIPWIIDRDWGVFMVASLGSALSLVESSLPQWQEEKWPGGRSQKRGGPTVILTRGNGSRYAALIKFDIMARGTRTVRPS
jgi:hypothetical protein